MSLVGYGVGALVFGPLSDRFGRHSMLIAAMMATGLGSLYSMLSPNEPHFVLSRLITGIGVGADLAIINVFVSEISPRGVRGGYTSLLFIMAAFGSALGIWLGLFLTTPMGLWPAEVFPTRFRATAYAVADSIGHVGGLGVFLVVGALGRLPLQATMLVLVFFLLAGALVNLLAPNTRKRNLEDTAR
jgi:putative MFS transporter